MFRKEEKKKSVTDEYWSKNYDQSWITITDNNNAHSLILTFFMSYLATMWSCETVHAAGLLIIGPWVRAPLFSACFTVFLGKILSLNCPVDLSDIR